MQRGNIQNIFIFACFILVPVILKILHALANNWSSTLPFQCCCAKFQKNNQTNHQTHTDHHWNKKLRARNDFQSTMFVIISWTHSIVSTIAINSFIRKTQNSTRGPVPTRIRIARVAQFPTMFIESIAASPNRANATVFTGVVIFGDAECCIPARIRCTRIKPCFAVVRESSALSVFWTNAIETQVHPIHDNTSCMPLTNI